MMSIGFVASKMKSQQLNGIFTFSYTNGCFFRGEKILLVCSIVVCQGEFVEFIQILSFASIQTAASLFQSLSSLFLWFKYTLHEIPISRGNPLVAAKNPFQFVNEKCITCLFVCFSSFSAAAVHQFNQFEPHLFGQIWS